MALTPPPAVSIDPVSEGSHHAVITQIVDKGHQRTKNFNTGDDEIKHQVHVCFELPQERDARDRPRQISQSYTLSSHAKSGLRRLVHAAFGKSLTDEEIIRVSYRDLLGKNVFLSIEQKTKTDGSGRYSKVASVNALPRGFPSASPEGELVFYEVESGDPPNTLPDWLIKTINESLERKGDPLPGEEKAMEDKYPLPPRPRLPESFDEFENSSEESSGKPSDRKSS